MPAIGNEIFIQTPSEAKGRILHPGHVVGVNQSVYTLLLEEADLQFSPGQEVLVYFEQYRSFMQQAARISALIDHEEASPEASSANDAPAMEDSVGSIIGLETVGEPSSAESRDTYRVSTLLAQLTADVLNEEDCALVDVSATGFAIITKQHLQVGQVVPVCPKFEGKKFEGEACVQSIRHLGDGRIRYGMHCVTKRGAGMLMRGLQQISMAIQRQQLKRMSRA